jgi:HK97 family phage portal protein
VKILGFDISRSRKKDVSAVRGNSAWGWFGPLMEPFAGAWQKNIVPERRENLVAFSAVYACISLISEDIAKLCLELVETDANGVQTTVERNSPYAAVLRKPNDYQTTIQFINLWLVMRLMYGNAYILKQRDSRRIVTRMYVLDSRQVTPMVADDGSVFYQVNQDRLHELPTQIRVPGSEIIHDRGPALFHPLIGVSPLFACAASATQGIRIQYNSAAFFENMSRPSGQLTAEGTIEDVTADRLKREFENNFGGRNLGKLFVSGDGLKYEPITIPAADAQLIEQLRWTVEDVARCFRVPLHKIASGANPTFNNVSAMNQDYYSQTLQYYIESIEELLEDGLGLENIRDHDYGIEFDLEGLLRMDPIGRAEANAKAISGGYLAPNEARKRENLKPVDGGDTPYLQQQNYSLAALAKRDAGGDPFATAAPSAPAPAAGPSPTPPAPAKGSVLTDPADAPGLSEFALKLIAQVTKQVNELEPDHA